MTPDTLPSDGDAIAPRPVTRRIDHGVTTMSDHGHAVSWAAILAGAAGAAALSLILLVLGVGLGLSSVSPWTAQGASATTMGVGTIVWLLFVALAASGIGGYLAGRLRSRWADAHVDEVYFRDTAHGFLAWAIATLVTASLLTSTIGSIVGTGAQAGGGVIGSAGIAATTMAGSEANQSMSGAGLPYFTDSLFRPSPASASASAASPSASSGDASRAAQTAETGRILARSLANGAAMTLEDAQYVGQIVAQRTGMAPADAERRVNDTYAKAQQSIQDAEAKAKGAADKARKAAAYVALWLFVCLLVGAFVSSLMATFGGRQRDL